MRLSVLVLVLSGCVDAPLPDDPPATRLVAIWDPLACGEPHRVVVELVDDDSHPESSSAPCALASLSIDLPHRGLYRGKIYAWVLHDQPEIRSIRTVELFVDEPVVRWTVPTPE
jgi:hypothetical protein